MSRPSRLPDFIPTFAGANGETDLVEKVRKGYRINGKTYRVHLDGYNLLPFLKDEEKESPRQGFPAGQVATRVEFHSDPDGAKGYTGEYHLACSKPFVSLANAMTGPMRRGAWRARSPLKAQEDGHEGRHADQDHGETGDVWRGAQGRLAGAQNVKRATRKIGIRLPELPGKDRQQHDACTDQHQAEIARSLRTKAL
jgi:hypothetical protein